VAVVMKRLVMTDGNSVRKNETLDTWCLLRWQHRCHGPPRAGEARLGVSPPPPVPPPPPPPPLSVYSGARLREGHGL